MKDIMYAGFAQLSYLDWHKSDNKSTGLKLSNIFSNDTKIFNQIIIDSYINMYGGEKLEGDVVIKGVGYKITKTQKIN